MIPFQPTPPTATPELPSPPPVSDTPAEPPAPPSPKFSAKRPAIIAVAGLLVIVALVAVFVNRSGGSVSAAVQGTTTTTLSLKARSTAGAKLLDNILCATSSSYNCDISSEEGVIELTLRGSAGDADLLNKAGDRSGFWTRADVARMGHTRGLDGTQRNTSGTVTWTYHPDHGLNIVVTVAPDYEIPGTAS
jgi:hypothetical protein